MHRFELSIRGDYFWFGSVFIKKSNQTEIIFLKKNGNRTETGLNRPVLFFRTKTGSNWFGLVWLDFFGLARFWLSFFRFCFGLGSVWFFRF